MSSVAVPVKFWTEDPLILFTDLVFFPTADMTREAKFNALTRLALAISLVMYGMDYPHWSSFLLISVIAIIVIYYSGRKPEVSECSEKEHFTVTPTRINDDFEQTIVAPLFSEEHRVPPPSYDMYSNPGIEDVSFVEPIRPQAYPYGQYMTGSNFLPGDMYSLDMAVKAGAGTAREFANNLYMRNEIAFRENMMRIYKKKLNRRFRSSNPENDTFSPYESY